MHIYRVYYAHENVNEPDETQKHGYAMQELEVDHEITTEEEVMEIARSIGREHGYTSVGVIKIEQRIESEEEDTD